jgi:2-amino-4-hydroxy-6-hydroxymethyldihydropteridine diphosphokinase
MLKLSNLLKEKNLAIKTNQILKQKMSKVLLSLGSNIGNKIENINKTIRRISEICKVEKTSSFYETEPFGNPHQDWFINIAAIIETDFPAEILLFLFKTIEFEIGRRKAEIWTERLIDIDILLYENTFIELKNLTIPHKFLHERSFVLIPATEIAGDFVHPILKQNIKQLNSKNRDNLRVKKLN